MQRVAWGISLFLAFSVHVLPIAAPAPANFNVRIDLPADAEHRIRDVRLEYINLDSGEEWVSERPVEEPPMRIRLTCLPEGHYELIVQLLGVERKVLQSLRANEFQALESIPRKCQK